MAEKSVVPCNKRVEWSEHGWFPRAAFYVNLILLLRPYIIIIFPNENKYSIRNGILMEPLFPVYFRVSTIQGKPTRDFIVR